MGFEDKGMDLSQQEVEEGMDLSQQEVEARQKARKEELRDLIIKLQKRFNYVKELKELKEKREREIASPTLELLWRQEYKILQDYIDILKIHEFMLEEQK